MIQGDPPRMTLLEQLQETVQRVAADVAGRETALVQARQQAEERASRWQTRWKETMQQLTARRKTMEESGDRAASLVTETEAELQQLEVAIAGLIMKNGKQGTWNSAGALASGFMPNS